MPIRLNLLSFIVCTLHRFLRILKLLVQDPAGADKAFLPSVISFVMSQILPLVSEQQNSDILLVLHELFYQLLLNNWRYGDTESRLHVCAAQSYHHCITDTSSLDQFSSTWIAMKLPSPLTMKLNSLISWK